MNGLAEVRTLGERFVRDEEGIALIFVAIMLPVVVGFSLLAIDMSRVNSLHNDLQSGVDALALAAAAELDGNSDAITRANAAIQNLVQNDTRFSTAGTHALTYPNDVTVTYLTAIPASDATTLSAAGLGGDGVNYATTDPAAAQFAEVTTRSDSPTTPFSTIFPASFIGGSDTMTLQTQAVAGFAGIVTCDMTPLFMCDPFKNTDGSGPGFDNAVANNLWIGRSVTLEVKGSSWGPGNFGFLRPSNNQGYGDNDLRVDLARGTVQECVNSRHLYTSTGNMTTNDIAGLNTRFDMFKPNGGGFPAATDTRWPAAPNVRKGYAASTNGQSGKVDYCSVQPGTMAAGYMGLPADETADPTITTGLVGNGTWDYQDYITTNNLQVVKAHFDSLGISQPTRYQVYIYETTNPDALSPAPINIASKGGEVGAPRCTTSNISTDPNRRLIYGAIVDCSDPNNIAALNGASGTTLKAEGFGSFLMLSPVVTTINTEAVDISGRHGNGSMANFARDNVQLYR